MGGKQDGMGKRLSKPRTNNNSSPNLLNFTDQPLESSSPFTSSDMDYFGDATVVTSQGERRSRRKSRSKIRAYLYGSHSESSQTLSSDEDDQSPSKRLSGAAQGARRRLSRTGSAFMQLSNARSSTSQSSNPSNSNLLLAYDTEESVMVAETIKEKAHIASLAAHNHVSSPIDEEKHVDSIFAPVRRKSLYTPGIATRNAGDILRKPPPPLTSQNILTEADRNYYYNPAHPETSPLARLAALNISEDGRSTPSNLNIPHLGGLQLGTLRVMNGAASPIPQMSTSTTFCSLPSQHSIARDESHMCSEGSGDEGRMTPRSTLGLRSNTINSPVTRSAPPAKSMPEAWNEQAFLDRQLSVNSGPESPGCSSAMADAYIAELSGSPFSRCPSARKPTHDIFDDEAIAIPEMDWVKMAEVHELAQNSREDAFEKLNGDSLSPSQIQRLSIPYSFSSNYDGALEATAKPDSGYNSHESLDVKQCPLLEYDMDRFEVQDSKHGSKMPLSHAPDNAKFGAPPKLQPSFTVIPRHAMKDAESKVGSTGSLESTKASRPPDRPTSRILVRKLQKSRPKSQPPPLQATFSADFNELAESDIPRVPSLMAAKHAERITRFPLLKHTFPSPAHTSSRDSTSLKEVSTLPVIFPLQLNAPEAVGTITSMNSVLRGVNMLEGGEGPFQKTSPIEEKHDGEDKAFDIIRSPSWSNFGRSKRKKEQKKLVKRAEEERRRLEKEERELAKRLEQDRKDLERQLKKEERKGRSSGSRTSSRIRGRSTERRPSQYEASATIADFGTISTAIGSSPYDIATAIHPNAGRDASGSHPYQMTSVIQKPRSIVGEDDVISSEAKHSRSRASSQGIHSEKPDSSAGWKPLPQTMLSDAPPIPALSASDIRAHGLDWAKSGQRRRSYSTQSNPQSEPEYTEPGPFNDRGGVPGKMLRPHSMMLAAPPVPALPSLQRVEQQEGKVSQSRPRSMVIDPSSDSSSIGETIKSTRVPRNQQGILTPPEARSSKLVVPDLWSNGSLEKRSPKQEAPNRSTDESAIDDTAKSSDNNDNNSMWEAHRRAWSQRRKSAGEALIIHTRTNKPFLNPVESFAPTLIPESRTAPLLGPVEEGVAPELWGRGALIQSTSCYSIPRKRVGSGPPLSAEPTSTLARLSGRYEGGLQYGYEPGCGLGGSAGTRGAKTEASRKSVDVSRGFGLDLSDVPVFVAATPKETAP